MDVAEDILARYGCDGVAFSGSPDALYERHLLFDNAIDPAVTDARERFEALARSVRDVLSQRWVATKRCYERDNVKRVYYLSMEFLIGRSLANNVTNLLLDPIVAYAVEHHDVDWVTLLDQEPDAGLGNGGLGRLAACFLDSMATMQLPAMGCGLRYEFGMFKQSIVDGWQHEEPDHWLQENDPWEIKRLDQAVEVRFNCTFELLDGTLRAEKGHPSSLLGIPYDRPIVGYEGKTINTLRLWQAAATNYFDFKEFSEGDFVSAMVHTLTAESLTRVLYPDDSTTQGRALRFIQEYFLVACSLGDAVRRFRRLGNDWHALPDKVAVQLNDTHPSIAVAELMRILLDEGRLGWDEAWDLTVRTLAYTNHTLLPEALEKWPVEWFETLIPRHLEIIHEIDRHLAERVLERFPGDDAKVERTSLFEMEPVPQVRMAHLAIVGSHSTNGVAKIHSELLRTTTVKDLADVFPDRFNNKTNGITPRRWLLMANPTLASTITEAIGSDWVENLDALDRLKPLADDRSMRDAFRHAKHQAKAQFTNWLAANAGIVVDPQTIFDCQIKRIHEYKRQLLNVLRIVSRYQQLRDNPNLPVHPRTFFFAGKAAPAYAFAKLVIKLINNVASVIDNDPAMRGKLKIVFLPEYNVSLAERLIPAADISNQISTAGFEASGTSNMKFMMNGALTVGTRDGATIEMAEAAGEENFFLFGLSAQEVRDSRTWYDPHRYYENEPPVRAALDAIFNGEFSRNEPDVFEPLRAALLDGGDYYRHLADLLPYVNAQHAAGDLYFARPDDWARCALLNIASSGRFSSDRTIAEYAREIWNLAPVPV
ncbi:MAG TPA: glycogen/starch/alpha-glucan phosphorylase [Candidatus Baltobacteraceae bacterium]|nr:glycogen/starch/alpha-glucan phosphorylase [Candidatus Baltobacteraceae bacterium]